MKIDLTGAQWIHPPRISTVGPDTAEIVTEPGTDFWQRSYYGFRNDNAPALLLEIASDFSFSVKAEFDYRVRFDQCGVMVYLDSENWFKASIEYENAQFSRLGSVVTNFGYSDWATTDIETPRAIWYRLSRRGPDFLIESSPDGRSYTQMRIFHLHRLGETTEAMGKAATLDTASPIRFGLYACSPGPSSFTAAFSEFRLGECVWLPHEA